jgi:hypothetical protein
MAYDFRANQVRLNRIISSGSIPIIIYPSSSAADFAGNLVPSFSTTSIGSDVFLYVSGSSNAKTVFGGDVVSSGSFRSLKGLTGSLQYTDDSSTPFIVGGPDITTNYNSLGQWEISGSEASFFTSPSNNVVQTTGSFEATYLSASSGAEITGSLLVNGGITGSISGTIAGNPFLKAGLNITTNYNSLGQWEITGSATGTNFWTELDSTNIYTTSSIEVARLSASLGAIITGSVVQGVGCTAINNSHAEGYESDVSAGSYGHAEGYQTDVTGQAAHAEGNSTTAAGDYSHAEGISTNANGNYSHSEGNSTTATGEGAHSEGKDTQAVGDYSHAEGSGSIAAGDYSHASGLNTEAFANYQTAVGKFNLTSNSDSLFVVGDGLNLSNRHDALRVNSGSVQVTGSLFVTQEMSASIISASYVRANNIDITPITAQLTIGGDGVNRASGSISGLLQSGSLMTAGTVGKFDVEVLAMDYNFATGASWKYSVTALWPLAGSFTILASTEIAAEYGPTAGSYNPTNDWDVNFNDLGQVELTGSSPAFPSGGTSFYVQVTKKMIGGYGTIIA